MLGLILLNGQLAVNISVICLLQDQEKKGWPLVQVDMERFGI